MRVSKVIHAIAFPIYLRSIIEQDHFRRTKSHHCKMIACNSYLCDGQWFLCCSWKSPLLYFGACGPLTLHLWDRLNDWEGQGCHFANVSVQHPCCYFRVLNCCFKGRCNPRPSLVYMNWDEVKCYFCLLRENKNNIKRDTCLCQK